MELTDSDSRLVLLSVQSSTPSMCCIAAESDQRVQYFMCYENVVFCHLVMLTQHCKSRTLHFASMQSFSVGMQVLKAFLVSQFFLNWTPKFRFHFMFIGSVRFVLVRKLCILLDIFFLQNIVKINLTLHIVNTLCIIVSQRYSSNTAATGKTRRGAIENQCKLH